MASNLIEQVKNIFAGDFTAKAASAFGESENGIKQAIAGAVPAVFARLLQKSETNTGASDTLNMAKEATADGSAFDPSSLITNANSLPGIASITNNLFGDRLTGIANALSTFSGIKQSSAVSILSIAAPAILSFLGNHAQQHNLSAADMRNLLDNQKDNVLASVPATFNLAGSLGLGSLSALGAHAQTFAPPPETPAQAAKKSNGWFLPLILILIVLALIWYFMKSCNKHTEVAPPVSDTTIATAPPATDTTVVSAKMPESIKVKLPDGTELDAYKGGIEDMLVMYLNSSDPADSISKSRWFDFDNLNFKTGSSELTDSSMKQVQNITAILKAYPKVKIKIGGYTDKTGDEAANMKLSKDRAATVASALKKAGTNASQITGSEGYGSQFAKAAAEAPDDQRKLDRRISVNVKEK